MISSSSERVQKRHSSDYRATVSFPGGMSLHREFALLPEQESRYESTRSAAWQPVEMALPTDNPPLWLPSIRKCGQKFKNQFMEYRCAVVPITF